jgi:hypothetical protein
MYKAYVSVCSEIRTKQSTQSEHHVEFLNVNCLTPKLNPSAQRFLTTFFTGILLF